MPTVKCDYCGEETYKRPSTLEKHNHKFCSRECQGKWQSENPYGVAKPSYDVSGKNNPHWKGGKETKICEVCGEEFKIPKAWLRKDDKNEGRFCSRKCMEKWMSENWRGEGNPSWRGRTVTRTCRNCGKEFEIQKCRIEKEGKNEGRFCSKDCATEWYSGEKHPCWKGGTSYLPYSPDWREKRRKALERDNYTCQRCGLTNDESLKRFDEELSVHHKNGDKFDSRQENLITLCKSCHQAIENSIRVQA